MDSRERGFVDYDRAHEPGRDPVTGIQRMPYTRRWADDPQGRKGVSLVTKDDMSPRFDRRMEWDPDVYFGAGRELKQGSGPITYWDQRHAIDNDEDDPYGPLGPNRFNILSCPELLLSEGFEGWAMGFFGGGVFAAYQIRKSVPKNIGMRGMTYFHEGIHGGFEYGRAFGAWMGLFSVLKCTIACLRNYNDEWNAGFAGGLTSSILSTAEGFPATVRSFSSGFLLLFALENLGTVFDQPYNTLKYKSTRLPKLEPPGEHTQTWVQTRKNPYGMRAGPAHEVLSLNDRFVGDIQFRDVLDAF